MNEVIPFLCGRTKRRIERSLCEPLTHTRHTLEEASIQQLNQVQIVIVHAVSIRSNNDPSPLTSEECRHRVCVCCDNRSISTVSPSDCRSDAVASGTYIQSALSRNSSCSSIHSYCSVPQPSGCNSANYNPWCQQLHACCQCSIVCICLCHC